MQLDKLALVATLAMAVACGSAKGNLNAGDGDGDSLGNGDGDANGSDTDDGDGGDGLLGGSCTILPANHVFNSRIDGLRVHPNSDAFLSTIGDVAVHLDLGTQTDQTQEDFYGIPYNFVNGSTLTWTHTSYDDIKTVAESDCGNASHVAVSPCTGSAMTNAVFPIPANVVVEGGISGNLAIYGDHHMLLVDRDACELWELGNAYLLDTGWQTSWTAYFDLRSNALRPSGWSSSDAAGFPIFPLLIRQEEAATGEIRHAFRFTIDSEHIRRAFTWPARHLTSNGTTSADQPPMGQLFRLKSSYVIPSGASAQSRAILVALQRYGMYLADGGSPMYITGSPSAAWASDLLDVVQELRTGDFEAVDLEAVASERAGFDVNSGALP